MDLKRLGIWGLINNGKWIYSPWTCFREGQQQTFFLLPGLQQTETEAPHSLELLALSSQWTLAYQDSKYSVSVSDQYLCSEWAVDTRIFSDCLLLSDVYMAWPGQGPGLGPAVPPDLEAVSPGGRRHAPAEHTLTQILKLETARIETTASISDSLSDDDLPVVDVGVPLCWRLSHHPAVHTPLPTQSS